MPHRYVILYTTKGTKHDNDKTGGKDNENQSSRKQLHHETFFMLFECTTEHD